MKKGMVIKMQKKSKEKKLRPKFCNKNRLIYFIPFLLFLSILVLGAAEKAIPGEIYAAPSSSVAVSHQATGVSASISPENEYTAKLFGFIPATNVESNIPGIFRLCPAATFSE